MDCPVERRDVHGFRHEEADHGEEDEDAEDDEFGADGHRTYSARHLRARLERAVRQDAAAVEVILNTNKHIHEFRMGGNDCGFLTKPSSVSI